MNRPVEIVKYQDESWIECARRMGREARYEGKSLDSNPFPEGYLIDHWHDSWVETDDLLTKAEA